MGPGLITGAADDDPSGIATFTQAGAQFGYGQLWTALFILPFMTAIQEACARIGMTTGHGIAAVLHEHYSKKVLYTVVLLVLIANTINIGADIGAMAAAAQLLIPIPFVILTLFFTVIILSLEIFTSYKVYSRILKWLVVALVSYPLTVLLVSQPWGEIVRASVIPHLEFNFAFLFITISVIGTTISPYMFFWEASEEVEEHRGRIVTNTHALKMMRIDNLVGMIASQITTWSIIVVGATVLHAQGILDVKNAAEAAKALEPLVRTFPNSGFIAKLIFSFGIIGLSFLAVPVLSGSAAYALSEAFSWKSGLNLKLKRAHGFYGVITASTLIGLGINFIGIDPVKALVISGMINGLVSVPLIFLIAKIARNKKIMGDCRSGWLSTSLVWLTFVGVSLAALGLIITAVVH